MSTQGMSTTYNTHSKHQLAAIDRSLPFVERSLAQFEGSPSILLIADFGSSQGANSVHLLERMIAYLRREKHFQGQPLVIHNDLPSNHWTPLIDLLEEKKSYHGMINGRSFYEQCLPTNSLAIGHSSTAIHWLSKKPCNVRGHCYVGFSTDPEERRAFEEQAREDYATFLSHRAKELLPGGVLILAVLINDEKDRTAYGHYIHQLYRTAQLLPLTSEELTDFTYSFYLRSSKETLDEELFARHSLRLVHSELLAIESPVYQQWQAGNISFEQFAQQSSAFVRSWSQSILEQTLLKHRKNSAEDIPQLLDQFYRLYEQQIREQKDAYDREINYAYLTLKKISHE